MSQSRDAIAYHLGPCDHNQYIGKDGCGFRLRVRLEFRVRMLRVTRNILVQIIGTPVACATGVKDTWRDLAAWAADQLNQRYGQSVEIRYHDLFDPDCPTVPADAHLPLVLVDGDVAINGGKLSIPVLCKHLESLGLVRQSPV